MIDTINKAPEDIFVDLDTGDLVKLAGYPFSWVMLLAPARFIVTRVDEHGNYALRSNKVIKVLFLDLHRPANVQEYWVHVNSLSPVIKDGKRSRPFKNEGPPF